MLIHLSLVPLISSVHRIICFKFLLHFEHRTRAGKNFSKVDSSRNIPTKSFDVSLQEENEQKKKHFFATDFLNFQKME